MNVGSVPAGQGARREGAPVMLATAARKSVPGLMVLLLAVLLTPARASAHSDLTSSDPADADVLAQAPATVTLTFNEDLLAKGNAVTLKALATGERLDVGPVLVDGPTVTVEWPEQSPAGEFRVAYRVVSADGHPIEGAITFTVEQEVAAVPALVSDSPSPPASESPTASAAPADEASAVPNPVATTAADEDRQQGPGALIWILAVGLVILVGAGAGTWVTRRAR
jgi:methionine-rich copper-binding protein CopC